MLSNNNIGWGHSKSANYDGGCPNTLFSVKSASVDTAASGRVSCNSSITDREVSAVG